MNDGDFFRVYKEFSDQHKNKNLQAIVASIPNIPLDALSRKTIAYYPSILCRSLSASFTTATPEASLTHLCKCFAYLWSQLLTVDEFVSICTKLETVFQSKTAPIFGHYAPEYLDDILAAFCALPWAPQGAQRFSALCRVIVMVAKIEIFNDLLLLKNTKRMLLYVCSRLSAVDGVDILQKRLFRTMADLVNAWVDSQKLSSVVDKVKQISHPETSDEYDTIITIILIISTMKPSFSRNADFIHALTIINYLADALDQPNAIVHSTQLIACFHCKDNVLHHTNLLLCNVGFSLLPQILKAKITIPHHLLHFAAIQLFDTSTLKCPNLPMWQQAIKKNVTNALCLKRYANGAGALIGLLNLVCINHTQYPALQGHLSDADFFQTLCSCHAVANLSAESAILAHYLQVISLMESDDYPSKSTIDQLNNSLLLVCKRQNQLTEWFDIYAKLEAMHWTYMQAMPIARIDEVKLLVQVVQWASMNPGGLSADMQNRLIARVFASAKTTTQDLCALRISNSFPLPVLPDAFVYKELRTRFNALSKKQTSIPLADKYRWYSIIANMEFMDYVQRCNEDERANKGKQFEFKDTEAFAIFRTQNVNYEAALVKKMQSALDWITKVADRMVRDAELCRGECAWEVANALVNLRAIGDHMALRLYREEAMAAYRQLHRLASAAGHDFGHIQAVTYFASNFHEWDSESTNLDAIVSAGCDTLQRLIETFDKLSARKRRMVLYCKMSVSMYYVANGAAAQGKAMLLDAERLLAAMERTNGDVDLARIRFNTIMLLLVTRYGWESPFPAVRLAETIIAACTSVRSVQHDESLLLPSIMYETLWELARFLMARFDLADIETVMAICLKISGRAGSAFKSSQLLCMWAMVNLYKEAAEGCEQKFGIIDDLLPMFSTIGNGEKAKTMQIIAQLPINVSPVRHVSEMTSCITPIRVMKYTDNIPSTKYLAKHPQQCSCLFCARPTFRFLLIDLSTVYCRLFFIKRRFDESILAFRQMHAHWHKHQERYAVHRSGCYSQNMVLATYRMFWFYGQSLRKCAKYDVCLEMLRQAATQLRAIHDAAMEHELRMQMENAASMADGGIHVRCSSAGQLNATKCGEKLLMRSDFRSSEKSAQTKNKHTMITTPGEDVVVVTNTKSSVESVPNAIKDRIMFEKPKSSDKENKAKATTPDIQTTSNQIDSAKSNGAPSKNTPTLSDIPPTIPPKKTASSLRRIHTTDGAASPNRRPKTATTKACKSKKESENRTPQKASIFIPPAKPCADRRPLSNDTNPRVINSRPPAVVPKTIKSRVHTDGSSESTPRATRSASRRAM